MNIVVRYVVIGLMLGGLRASAQSLPAWPDGTPQQLSEDVFGLRLRVEREVRGDKGGEKFLRKEFEKGPSVAAKAYMAWVCFYGKGWGMPALVDPARGKVLALEAVRAGSPVATDVYARAIGQNLVPGVPPRATIVWLRRGVELGVPRSMARLGWYQAIGYYMPADPVQGLQLARQAAELGMPDGLVDIAASYEKGKIGGKPNLEMALGLYREAARHASGYAWHQLKELAKTNQRAQLMLEIARVHEANDGAWMLPRRTRGLVQNLEAIAGDDPEALRELGEAYLVGYYAEKDLPHAKELFQRAAAQGNEDARFFLAKMKLRGWAGPKTPGPALEEIQSLAEAGNVPAMAYLGYVCYWGASEAPGIGKDERRAFHYVRRAAEKGDFWSLVNLAFCYEQGIGTPENNALAAKVYWQAFIRGYQRGLERTRRHLAFVKP